MHQAIEATQLTKRYGTFTAVDSIDFYVPFGVCFGILGPNGAGKTSTIQMITCKFPPSDGCLHVLGMDVSTSSKAIKARCGLVPQDNNLDEDLSLLENLELYGLYFGIPGRTVRKRAPELLEFMHLASKAKEPVRALSGGMKRRAMIARALINQPDLVILDEPTTGLDPQSRVLLWDRLRDLKKEGVTLLLTTHYMDEAQRLCDDIVIMHEGHIIDRDSPANLIRKHVGEWAAEIELTPGFNTSSIEEIRTGSLRQSELTGSILHLFADDNSSLEDAIHRIGHTTYHIRPANLEDVFLVRTGRDIDE